MPKVPYSSEVNGKLVTGNSSLIPICSLSNRSLLPKLTVHIPFYSACIREILKPLNSVSDELRLVCKGQKQFFLKPHFVKYFVRFLANGVSRINAFEIYWSLEANKKMYNLISILEPQFTQMLLLWISNSSLPQCLQPAYCTELTIAHRWILIRSYPMTFHHFHRNISTAEM